MKTQSIGWLLFLILIAVLGTVHAVVGNIFYVIGYSLLSFLTIYELYFSILRGDTHE